jgi:hypothetical protein
MQARRFVASLDPSTEAAGPNQSSGFAPVTIPGKSSFLLPRELTVERLALFGDQLVVGIRLEAQGDETGLGFALNYDPAALSNPVVALGADASGAVLTLNDLQASAGKLGVLLDKAPGSPFAAGGKQVLVVTFNVVTGAPQSTNLTFGADPVLSEVVDGTANALTTTFSPATISLLSPTAAGVNVSGRVFNRNGYPLRNASVTLVGAGGVRRIAITNAFGYFSFEDIAAGQNYTIEVKAKGLSFAPRLILVNDDVTGIEFSPTP